MDIHKNACLTPHSRALLVHRVIDQGQSADRVAAALGVSIRTVGKSIARYRAEGAAGYALSGGTSNLPQELVDFGAQLHRLLGQILDGD